MTMFDELTMLFFQIASSSISGMVFNSSLIFSFKEFHLKELSLFLYSSFFVSVKVMKGLLFIFVNAVMISSLCWVSFDQITKMKNEFAGMILSIHPMHKSISNSFL